MVDEKISELTAATSVSSPDVVPVVQSGVTKKADVSLFGVTLPITLNPGDVLAQDASDNPLISLPGDGSQLTFDIPRDIASPYFAVQYVDGEDLSTLMVIPGYSDIQLNAAPGKEEQPQGNYIQLIASDGYDDGEGTPTNGGGITIQVGNPSNDGVPGVIELSGQVTFDDFLLLTPASDPPSPAAEGMVYADTDHHLYYYNGTTWKQLDN